jgi:hypothetical protein
MARMINSLNTQLRKLIEQGADVKIVKGYLQKNCWSKVKMSGLGMTRNNSPK